MVGTKPETDLYILTVTFIYNKSNQKSLKDSVTDFSVYSYWLHVWYTHANMQVNEYNGELKSLREHLYQQVQEQSVFCDVTVEVNSWVCIVSFFSFFH